MPSRTRVFAVALAAVMLLSVVAPVVGLAGIAFTGEVEAAPSGMVGVPSENIGSDLPPKTPMGEAADQLVEAGVHASNHSDSLEVKVTSPGRAKSKYTGGEIHGDGPVALVFVDDENTEGREVAVSAAELEDILGYRPTAAFGTHTVDGADEEWSRAIEYDDGYAVIPIESFSTNTVTFTGGVSIAAADATTSSTFNYMVDDASTVDNFDINLTGREATSAESTSGIFGNGETFDVDVGGTTTAKNAEITLSGREDIVDQSTTISDGGTLEVGGTHSPTGESVTFTGSGSSTSASDSGTRTGDGSASISVGGNLAPTSESVSVDLGEGSISEESTTEELYYEQGDGTHYLTDDGPVSGNLDTENIDTIKSVSIQIGLGDLDDNLNWQSGTVELEVNGVSFGTVTANDGGSKTWHTWDSGEYDASGTNSVTVTVSATDSNGGAFGSSNDPYNGYVTGVDIPDSIQVNGNTVSDGGSTGLNLNTGSNSLSFSGSNGASIDWSASWTENEGTENPSVTIDGSTASHTGVLQNGETASGSLDLSTGTHSASVSTASGPNPTVDVDYTEVSKTEDPSVSVAGQTVSHTGVLGPTETVTEPLTLDPGLETADVSTTHEVDTQVDWTEVSESKDPTVIINEQATSYDGTLAAGETASLTTQNGWIQDGQNNVSVDLAGANGGPTPQVEMDYSHEAGSVDTGVEYSGTTWSESYNVSNTFVGDQTDARMSIPFDSDRVIDIRDFETRWNGGTWSSVDEADYTLEDTNLTVEFGAVSDGDTVEVRANGTKVRSYDGNITVTSPTVEGDSLATTFKVDDVNPDGQFGVDVSETDEVDRIHYAADQSFEGEVYVENTASGVQILRAPDAVAGSTITVETVPMDVTPESGAIETVVEDAEDPRFILREGETVGASTVEVEYRDTLSGERYVLWSESAEREIDADRAESPVFFTTDGSTETYSIRQMDAVTTGDGGGSPPAESSSIPSILVVPAVALSVAGLWFVGRRFGGESSRGIRGNAVLVVGASIIAIVAAELVTARSLSSDVIFGLSDALASGAGAVILGLAVLLGLWYANEKTETEIPLWIQGTAGILVVVMAGEAIRPGSMLGWIGPAFSEVGAAVVLFGLIGILVLAYRRASTPENEFTLQTED